MWKIYQIKTNDQTFYAECLIHSDTINCRNLTFHDSREPIVIMCCETYELFPTAAAACKAHGIQPSRLSNHLNARPGNRAIRGRSYQRVPLSRVGGAQALAAGKVQAPHA